MNNILGQSAIQFNQNIFNNDYLFDKLAIFIALLYIIIYISKGIQMKTNIKILIATIIGTIIFIFSAGDWTSVESFLYKILGEKH